MKAARDEYNVKMNKEITTNSGGKLAVSLKDIHTQWQHVPTLIFADVRRFRRRWQYTKSKTRSRR